ITVLDNRDEVLPLDPSIGEVAVLNVGEAQEIQPFLKELSQYTRPVEFRLGKNLPEADGNRLRNALAKYKRILVCVTEHRLTPYQNFFAKFAPDVPVVYLFFIPGKQVLQIKQGDAAAEAVILAHSSNEEVQRQVARIVYGSACSEGRLSASIGSRFAAGAGVTLTPQSAPRFVPEEHGMNSRLLAEIDKIAEEGIR
ncbi:beta-N-acetylglucosaminidase, partial [Phocaeicola vulgatus]|nr:beta-N-acetylglucosaminidase [Phocaeicola vulgatus]